MESDQQRPPGSGSFGRAIRFRVLASVRRRWLRWRWLAGPLPRGWWSQFERDFRAYCGTTGGRSRRTKTDL